MSAWTLNGVGFDFNTRTVNINMQKGPDRSGSNSFQFVNLIFPADLPGDLPSDQLKHYLINIAKQQLSDAAAFLESQAS